MSQKFWDRLGAGASTVCAVHCVLTGVALGLLSSLGFGFFANPALDYAFIGLAVLVGAIALWHGVKRHGSYVPALFYVAGLGFVLAAHFEDLLHGSGVEHRHGLVLSLLSAAGGLCFVLFHVLNLRLRRCTPGGSDCRHTPVASTEP